MLVPAPGRRLSNSAQHSFRRDGRFSFNRVSGGAPRRGVIAGAGRLGGMALLRVRRGNRRARVRVLGGFVCQKRESAWMGVAGKAGTCLQVRVSGGFVCQKPESAWIRPSDAKPGGRTSIHFRRFGTCEGLLPARKGSPSTCGARTSIHFRRFGACGRRAPASRRAAGCPRVAGYPHTGGSRDACGLRGTRRRRVLCTPRRSAPTPCAASHFAPHLAPHRAARARASRLAR